MANVCPDNHREVQFGSGDYYIFCHSCGRKWMLHGDATSVQPEYITDQKGNVLIGADATKATGYHGDSNLRVRKEP